MAALIEPHPDHERSLPWLARARRSEIAMHLAAHSLAELYSVLSTLPVRPRLAPAAARRLIRESIEGAAAVVQLTAGEYRQTLDRLADLGLAGGVVYDALIARAAEKAGAELLLTLNPDDFRRVWPDGRDRVTTP